MMRTLLLFLLFPNFSKEKFFTLNLRLICLGMFFAVSANQLFAQSGTVTSNNSGNWNASATWTAGNINRSGTVTSTTASTTVTGTGTLFLTELTIGSVITRQDGTAIGTVSSITSNTSLTLTANASNNVANQTYCTISGPPSPVDNVIIGNNHVVNVNDTYICAAINIGTSNGNVASLNFSNSTSQLTVNGVFTLGGNNVNRVGTLNMTNGGTLITNSINLGNTSTSNLFIAGSGTVRLAANNTLPSSIFTTFNNLSINAGSTTMAAALNINGNLNIDNGATLTSTTSNYAVTLRGNYTNAGTFTANSSSITIDGTSNQSITGFTTGGAVSMTKTGGTAVFTGNVTGNALTINGSGGTLNLGSGTHTFTGNVTLTAGTLNGGSSTLNVNSTSAAAWGGTGTNFTAGTSTVNFRGNNQTISSTSTTFYNLNLLNPSSTSVTKTFSSATTVTNLWTIAKLTIANLGTFQHNAGILTLGGVGPLNLTWGHTSSNPVAANTNNTYFANNTGRITITQTPPGAAIDNNYAYYGTVGEVTGIRGEYDGSLTLTAPVGSIFINVKFASYGLPNGTAPNFTIGTCHAFNSRTVTTGLLGNTSATIPASGSFNNTFGDPCYGIVKNYYVTALYTTPICSGTNPGTITGSVATGGNGTTYNYLWEVSTTSATDGFTAAPGANTGVNYTVLSGITTKTYYRRTVTSGIYSDETIVVIPVNTIAEITAPTTANSTATSICSGTSVTLTATGGGFGTVGGYAEWTSGTCNGTLVGRSALANGSLTVTPTANTTYFVKHKNSCGETVCATPVTVTNPTSITVSTSSFSTCFSSAIQNIAIGYSATTNTPTNYSITWNAAAVTAGFNNKSNVTNTFATGIGSIANAITINANTAAGTYTGTLTVQSGTCTSFGTTITVVINPQPATPTASVTTQPTCTVPTGVITITNPAPAAGITYSIDGTTYTNTTGVFSGLAAGSYNVTAKNSSGCESSITVVPVNAYVSKTWNGSVSTNWNTAGNWTPSGVPTADDCVVIPDLTSIANKPEITGTNTEFKAHTINLSNNSLLTVQSTNTLTVTNAVTVNTGSSLTFENNASLVQKTNAVNSGNITYKRNTQLIRRYDFTYWSAPVTAVPGITLHDLSPTTLADKYYSYNPNTGWTINYNGTLVMAPGQGYIVRSPQEYDINTSAVYQASFTGVPNNGDITFTPTAAKWNLIGNPYPSAIDADKLINDTGVGALYFWTHNSPPNGSVAGDAKYNYTVADYAVYTLTGSVATTSGAAAPTGSIAAGQGFFFKASTGSNIVFTNDMRIAGDNTQFFKTSETAGEANRLWLNFTNAEGAFKQALIGYINGATNSWDQNYDAATLNGNTYVDFYSIGDAKKLTVQGRALPFEDTDLIPLGYKTAVAGEFTISIDHTDGLLNNQAVYLEDKTTGTVYDLKAGNYKFTTEIGTFTDRFTLRYTNKTLGTGDFENVKDGLLVSVKDKTIKVTSSKENIKEVNIFDITGRLLYSKNKVGTAELSIPNLQAADQVLLVKTTLENKAEATRKIIFK